MRKPIVLIKSSQIRQHLSILEAVEVMKETFKDLRAGKSLIPVRYVISVAEDKLNILLRPVVEVVGPEKIREK
ncbi:hypothetical protein OU798_10245 [Prolixibacteraceae bacterium Z1-6]|uniref:Uncharacterized protein n=1 Tax=Draconibacterium aestuarii TaxID=2998507 RepID=A0A9X3FD21_9BACT|nr:hypothetical protein [Prolixibacteraceae bacterium Z1-6]